MSVITDWPRQHTFGPWRVFLLLLGRHVVRAAWLGNNNLYHGMSYMQAKGDLRHVASRFSNAQREVHAMQLYMFRPTNIATKGDHGHDGYTRNMDTTKLASTINPETASRNETSVSSYIQQEKLGQIDASLLQGRRKWLGGAISSDKSSIFGIPANAHGVLRVDVPDTNSSKANVSIIPLPEKKYWHGKFKWLRGILAQNDKYLYGIPAWSTQGVLQVNLHSNQVQVLPLPFSPLNRQREQLNNIDLTRWMWHGAALTKDEQVVICIPSNAQRVLRIDLPTNISNATVSEIGPELDTMRNKWYGGILGDDGAVYGVPYTTMGVLRVDPSTNDVQVLPVDSQTSTLNQETTSKYEYNWHGGVKSTFNGAIYAFPSHSDMVLKIDTRPSGNCSSSSSSGFDHVKITKLQIQRHPREDKSVTKYKWLGGCTGIDGCIYGMPSDATSVLKIDPRTDTCTTICPELLISKEKNKYQGGVLSPLDGCIYAIPCNAQNILRINTAHNHSNNESWRVSFVGSLPAVKDKWQGAFLARDGSIYGIPENFDRILKITPAPSTMNQFTSDVKIEFL